MFEQEQNTDRTSGRHASRLTIITASVLALAVLAGASAIIVRAQLMTNVPAATAAVKTERVLVGIDGMHCGTCASGIKSMLKRTPGVVAAEVSFEQKQANVEFDPAATSREKIVEAINNMGYKASVKG